MAIVCIEFEVKTVKLNERLISLRKDKRMSQQDLAEALNVSRQAVSRWEVGIAIPSMDNLLALSKLFGVATDELMGGDKVVSVPESEKTQGSGNRKGRSVLKVILIGRCGPCCSNRNYISEPEGGGAGRTKHSEV